MIAQLADAQFDTHDNPTLSDVKRFFRKVEFAADGCWNWAATRMPLGYGQISGVDPRSRRMLYAHRLAYSWFVGPIPATLTIDHLCANTSCVNPLHLEAVPIAENIRRAGARITHCKFGHEFSEKNTYRSKATGRRECRMCNARRGRELRERRRAAA